MGTPEFAVTILEALLDQDFLNIVAIVAQPDKPVGRKKLSTPPPTKILAQSKNVDVWQPLKLRDPEIIEKFKKAKPDLIIVAAYGKLILEDIINLPKYKTVNIHPSLLPKWRGPSPIQYAILNNEKKTGVSIMLIDKEMDHGPILYFEEIEILPNETTPILSKKLAKLSAQILPKILEQWISGKIKSKEQDHSKATFSKLLKKEDGHIDWSKSAADLEQQIKAFQPWPGSYTFWQQKNGSKLRIEILDAHKIENQKLNIKEMRPGRVFIDGENFNIICGKDALNLVLIQPEGKRVMSAHDFWLGHKNVADKIFE